MFIYWCATFFSYSTHEVFLSFNCMRLLGFVQSETLQPLLHVVRVRIVQNSCNPKHSVNAHNKRAFTKKFNKPVAPGLSKTTHTHAAVVAHSNELEVSRCRTFQLVRYNLTVHARMSNDLSCGVFESGMLDTYMGANNCCVVTFVTMFSYFLCFRCLWGCFYNFVSISFFQLELALI